MVTISSKSRKKHRTTMTFSKYLQKTISITRIIQKINRTDIELTPNQQSALIKKLPGLTSNQMEVLEKQSGPKLAASIRKIITPGRATTRSNKRRKNDR